MPAGSPSGHPDAGEYQSRLRAVREASAGSADPPGRPRSPPAAALEYAVGVLADDLGEKAAAVAELARVRAELDEERRARAEEVAELQAELETLQQNFDAAQGRADRLHSMTTTQIDDIANQMASVGSLGGGGSTAGGHGSVSSARGRKHRQQSSGAGNSPRGQRNWKEVSWKKGALLGQGAFGTVHIGLNNKTGEWMAVKNIPFNKQDPQIRKKLLALQNEIALMKQLDHPNIVRYFFSERCGDSINIFMEYVAGGSIQDLIKQIGGMPLDLVNFYTREILLGLDYLHGMKIPGRQLGIIHRDIKAANILLGVDGECRLADFGCSAAISETTARRNSLQGTPLWMAPEVITAQPYDTAVDIWSLGCTAMEMLTGQAPFAHLGLNQIGFLRWIADDSEPIETKLPEAVQMDDDDAEEAEDADHAEEMKRLRGLRSFLLSCLKRDPAERATAPEALNHGWVKLSDPGADEEESDDDDGSDDSGVGGLRHRAIDFMLEAMLVHPRAAGSCLSPCWFVAERNRAIAYRVFWRMMHYAHVAHHLHGRERRTVVSLRDGIPPSMSMATIITTAGGSSNTPDRHPSGASQLTNSPQPDAWRAAAAIQGDPLAASTRSGGTGQAASSQASVQQAGLEESFVPGGSAFAPPAAMPRGSGRQGSGRQAWTDVTPVDTQAQSMKSSIAVFRPRRPAEELPEPRRARRERSGSARGSALSSPQPTDPSSPHLGSEEEAGESGTSDESDDGDVPPNPFGWIKPAASMRQLKQQAPSSVSSINVVQFEDVSEGMRLEMVPPGHKGAAAWVRMIATVVRVEAQHAVVRWALPRREGMDAEQAVSREWWDGDAKPSEISLLAHKESRNMLRPGSQVPGSFVSFSSSYRLHGDKLGASQRLGNSMSPPRQPRRLDDFALGMTVVHEVRGEGEVTRLEYDESPEVEGDGVITVWYKDANEGTHTYAACKLLKGHIQPRPTQSRRGRRDAKARGRAAPGRGSPAYGRGSPVVGSPPRAGGRAGGYHSPHLTADVRRRPSVMPAALGTVSPSRMLGSSARGASFRRRLSCTTTDKAEKMHLFLQKRKSVFVDAFPDSAETIMARVQERVQGDASVSGMATGGWDNAEAPAAGAADAAGDARAGTDAQRGDTGDGAEAELETTHRQSPGARRPAALGVVAAEGGEPPRPISPRAGARIPRPPSQIATDGSTASAATPQPVQLSPALRPAVSSEDREGSGSRRISPKAKSRGVHFGAHMEQ